MPTLTSAQLSLIAQKRRKNPPSFYNSEMQTRQTIDQDTEAVLILLSSGIKNQAAAYLKSFLNYQDRSVVREALVDEFAERLTFNAVNSVLEFDTIFSSFMQFKNSLLGEAENTYITGLNPLLNALSIGLGLLKTKQTATIYNEVHLNAAEVVASSKLSSDQQKELRSWLTVLVAYA